MEEEQAYQRRLEEDQRQKQMAEEEELKRQQEAEEIQMLRNQQQRQQQHAMSQQMRQNEEIPTDQDDSIPEEGDIGNRKQPLFKASIGGTRSIPPQARHLSTVRNDDEDLDGQSTPAGPMPKSKGGPVPLMSLEIKAPEEEATTELDESESHNQEQSSALPKALEQALAFKSERAHEMGVHPEDIAQIESNVRDSHILRDNSNQNANYFDDQDDEESFKSKGKQRPKGKKKKKKKNRPQEWARQAEEAERKKREEESHQGKKDVHDEHPDVEVEYIQDKLEMDMSDPMYRTFSKIFEVFKIAENEEEVKKDKKGADADKEDSDDKNEDMKKVPHMLEDDDMVEEEEPDENKDKLSKRKLKKLNRLSVAELKQLVSRPDVVEMHDVTAKGISYM